MISYAHNGEDVVLARTFNSQSVGFYIDIGAYDPIVGSITKYFYDTGWCGINIEPLAALYDRLVSERPNDINLKVAVGARPGGKARFVELDAAALSGFADTINLPVIDRAGWGRVARTVETDVVSLAEIARRYVSQSVDFLKIDVEGAEKEVIQSADWRSFRPRVILVEAITPFEFEPAWHKWEGLLFDAGYEFALFDGVNRFYYRADEPELRLPLSVAANVLDGYVTARCKALQDRVTELEAKLAALTPAGDATG